MRLVWIMRILSLLFLISYSFRNGNALAISRTILIDPGHGGEDLGAYRKLPFKKANGKTYYKTVYEKDLALELAKKIHSKLSKKYTTYLTRSIDRTVNLNERADLAEKIKADLLISVHINSSDSAASHGFETYYLDNHEDVAVKKVEKAENNDLKAEDPIVQKILIDLAIDRTVTRSQRLSRLVHEEIKKKAGHPFKMVDRGIKPGLFYVLALSKRPGILLEAGFISNEREAKLLTNPKFQEAYANAVTKAVDKYFGVEKELPLF